MPTQDEVLEKRPKGKRSSDEEQRRPLLQAQGSEHNAAERPACGWKGRLKTQETNVENETPRPSVNTGPEEGNDHLGAHA